jgi:hypothetical protein
MRCAARWTASSRARSSTSVSSVTKRRGRRERPAGLSLFGLFAVTLMLVAYTFEQRSPWFVLLFAAACALGSAYGFLQGAWPFVIVEAVWTLLRFDDGKPRQRLPRNTRRPRVVRDRILKRERLDVPAKSDVGMLPVLPRFSVGFSAINQRLLKPPAYRACRGTSGRAESMRPLDHSACCVLVPTVRVFAD